MRWRCAGCGARPAPGDPYQWVCPHRGAGDDIDHVMVREGALAAFAPDDSENPFVRYRTMLTSYERWIAAGRADGDFVALVEELDDRVASVDGRGFRRTPLRYYDGLHAWVKDETGNVGGSHKGRHLFGLLLLIEVVQRLGLADASAPLAIASCGNAALAAAVMAAAATRRLDVFVPPDADRRVLDRLASLGARITACERDGSTSGDPCYHRFGRAVAEGALPFGCQGPDNGLTIEGGQTLAWEIAEELAPDRLVVQVGGGALASACIAGMRDAVGLGLIRRMPVIDTVQTTGAAPLARAHAAVLDAGGDVDAAARHRSRYMQPWATAPASVAHGILDDETYDWVAVVRGMIDTGGRSLVVDDALLTRANDLARSATGIAVDPTGSAGLAGVLALGEEIGADEAVAIVFSGGS